MTDNTIKAYADNEAWMRAFEAMTPRLRRWAFIASKMAERGKNFSDIARPNGRPSAWFISACAQGSKPMTARVAKALETELSIDLAPFLSPEEGRKKEPTFKEETL